MSRCTWRRKAWGPFFEAAFDQSQDSPGTADHPGLLSLEIDLALEELCRGDLRAGYL